LHVEILVRVNRPHPFDRLRPGGVDRDDLGVRLGRADPRRPKLPGDVDVVYVGASSRDQPGVLLAAHGPADVVARGGRPVGRLGRNPRYLGSGVADAHDVTPADSETLAPLVLAASSTALTRLW